jgi:hypothetical protein
MKKGLLTFFMIIAVFWTYGVSSAKDKDTGGQESKRSEMLQEEGRAKGKAAEKDRSIDKSKTDEGTSRGRNKGEAAEGAVDKGKEKGKAKENVTAKGKEHQQQMKALEKQMMHEEAKFLRSIARLKRIRELAAEQGNTKVVERVDKLIAKAQQINSDKHKRMQERKQKVLQLSEGKSGPDIPRVLDRSADKGKAREDKVAETEQPKTKVKPESEKVKGEPNRPEGEPGGQREKRRAERKG